MSKYILDSTVLIDHVRGRVGARRLLRGLQADGHHLGLCVVGVGELYSSLRPTEADTAVALVNNLEFYLSSVGIGMHAGQLRADLARQGITASITDMLIAATALAEAATVITANIRHFQVPGLNVLHAQSDPRQG